jgi:hypothetical protein
MLRRSGLSQAAIAQRLGSAATAYAWRWPDLSPIASPPMFQLIAYKGAANGWAPIGRPRPFADACRLMRAANQVNGDVWSYKLRCISPALPTFI